MSGVTALWVRNGVSVRNCANGWFRDQKPVVMPEVECLHEGLFAFGRCPLPAHSCLVGEIAKTGLLGLFASIFHVIAIARCCRVANGHRYDRMRELYNIDVVSVSLDCLRGSSLIQVKLGVLAD